MRYIALLWIGLLTATAASPVAAQVADMRGFGRVQVSMLPGGQGERFDCDSAQHAVLFIHKLARDMAASATAPSEWTDIVIAERNAPVLVRPGLGAFLVFARGATAYCLTSTLSGAQAASPASFPAAQTLIRDAVLYDPSYRYPMYLDKWSTAGIGSWYPYPVNDRWTQGHANTIDEHFEFARKYGLTIQPRNGHAALEDLLPKIHEYGLPYHFALWMEWSPSLAMLDPDDLIGPSSLFTYASGYYGQVSTGSKKLEQYQIWDWLQSVKDLVDDPNLVDWLDPNGEVGTISKVTNWDYSENNRANFAHWLRQVKGYTLPGLSGAWYGDTKRFNAWDRVPIPRGYDFYGYKPGDLLADKTWHIHTGTLQAGLALGYQKAAMADATWVKFQMPGGEVPAIEWRASTSTWYRGAFDVPKAWLASRVARGRIYLTVASLSVSRGWQNPDRVWINGQEIGALSMQSGAPITGQVDVTELVHAGANSVVYLPSDSADGVPGVFFLTASPMETYPFSDPHLNARFADWEEYCAWSPLPRVEATFKAIRHMDPNRPIKIHAAEDRDLYLPLIAKYGAYPHNTGNGGFLRAWDKRSAYVWGIPASAELGGPFLLPTEADALKRYFGFFTFEGINAFDQFHDIQDMMYHPVLNDLWAQYLPYFHLANRYELAKPQIALFFSERTNRLTQRSIPYAFDPGRGDLQSIGYSYVYVDEASLAAGLARSYPVIWDTGTSIIDTKTVENLKAYVRSGGTFVAIQDTGRHTLLQRDAWPISSLTGFRVRQIRPMTGTVTILHDQPLFSKLAGKSFYNSGRSIDYSDLNYADKCLVLEPSAPGTDVIARYQDGTIAIGLRCLGKGRVITLGSPFWRDSFDKLGYWHPADTQSDFLDDILAGLGLSPLCTSDNRQIWREHYVADNGTEEYLALWNQSDQPQTANLIWRTLHPAAALYDARNGNPMPATFEAGAFRIAGISLKPYETIILATQSERPPQECVADWFNHLALWQRVSAPGASVSRPDVPIYDVERQPRAQDLINVRGPFQVQSTQDSGLTTANIPGAFHGLFAYTTRLDIPTSWKGSRVLIRITAGDPAAYRAFAINDKVVFHPVNWPANPVMYMDITPWINLGGPNRLLLLPTDAAVSWTPEQLDIKSITLERRDARGQ